MTIKIKHKRGTASSITTANPTLAAGELAFETDTRRFKVGDGTTAWSSLSYVTPYVTATDRILGRSSAGAGSAEEITCGSFGRSLIGSADAAAARSTLSVQPTASPAFTGAATVTNDGNVVPLTVTNTGTANSFVVNDAAGDTSPVVIDASGNVGIGTSSPAAALDVGSGNLRFSSTAQRITGDFSNSTISNRLMFQTSTSNGNTSVRCIPNGTATVSNFVAHNGSDSNNTSFIALQASLTETIVNSGATGTGTYLPLTFYTNNAPQVQISTSGQLLVTAGSVSACGVAFSGDPDTGIAQLSAAGANTLSICTNSAERVRVGSGGNVAIGAIDPQTALHIDKNADGALVILRGAQTANTQHILFRNPFHTNNGSAGTAFVGAQDTGSSGGNLIFATTTNGSGASGTPTERMRIDASGNVGIGLVPTERFHVGRSGTGIAGRFTDNATQTLDIGITASAGVYLDNPNSGYVDVRIGSASKFKVGGDGALTAPDVYEDTVGATNRDLFIDSVGKLGYVSSIRSSKTNIAAIDDVSWLRDLTPVSFHYRKRNEDGTYSDEADGTLDYGLIAEEVEPVAPEMCFYDVVDGEPQLRGVHYSKLITPMLRYIQQLEQRIAALEERNHA